MDGASLAQALGLGPGSCVALIGGGGKTTLMMTLAGELRVRGLRPVVTTTTRIRVPVNLPLVLAGSADLRSALDEAGAACLGSGVSAGGKLQGIEPALVDQLVAAGQTPLLVEADGSAGRPLKVHAAHEPVVPPSATDVLIVAGIDAVGRPFDEQSVHRAGIAVQRYGWIPGQPISPGQVAAVLQAMERFVPPHARSWFVLNKVEDTGSGRAARAVAAHLPSRGSGLLMVARGRMAPEGAVPVSGDVRR